MATALVLWLGLLAPRGLGGPVSVVWVRGTSMEPGLDGGDVAVVYRQGDYDVGDVVAFEIPEGGIVIHRIIDEAAGGYRTQGDNRDRPDPWTPDEGDVVGRQMLTIPGGTRILAMLANPWVLGALTALLVFLRSLQRAEPGSRDPR